MADDRYVIRRLALVVVAAAAVTPAPAAGEAAITRTGWWTRNPVASAPDGGLDVGMGPDGAPLSIAAIEVAAGGAVTRAVLTLAEAGGIAPAGAALAVCTTADEWASGPNQPMEDAPSPACDAGDVAMTRNAASATWAADVTPLLRDVGRDGSATLMVVPAASAAAPLGFDVQLGAPQLQSEVDTAPAPTTTTTSTPPAAPPSSTTTTTPPSSPPPSPATTGSDGDDRTVAASGRAATTTSTSTPAPTTPTTTAVPDEAAEIVTAMAERPASPPQTEGPLPGPWWQVALAVLIGDLLALGRAVAQRAQRASSGTYSRVSGPA